MKRIKKEKLKPLKVDIQTVRPLTTDDDLRRVNGGVGNGSFNDNCNPTFGACG